MQQIDISNDGKVVNKQLKKLFICIFIVMLSLFFCGFFTARSVYAAEDNKTKNINIIREVFLNEGKDISFIDNAINTHFNNLTAINSKYLIIGKATYDNAISFHFIDTIPYLTYRVDGTYKSIVMNSDCRVTYLQNDTFPVSIPSVLSFRNIARSKDKSDLNNESVYKVNNHILYTNVDLVYDDTLEDIGINSGTVFFSGPKGILPPIMGAMNLSKTMEQLVYLLPLSIALITLYLALRKALALLRQILLQA